MFYLLVIINFIMAGILGYFVGAFNPAYFLGRLNGIDIRKEGSHNAGATNVFLSIGAIRAVIVMLIDILKMVFVLWVVQHFFLPIKGLLTCTGISTLVGHCYPFYLNFEGGKGIASYFGMVVYALPPIAIVVSFLFYWASSGVLYFILKKRKYVVAMGPLIGTLYFLVFATTLEHKVMGVMGGVLLCLFNIQKANAREHEEELQEKEDI